MADIDCAIEERIHRAAIEFLEREGPSQSQHLRRAIGATDDGLLDYIVGVDFGGTRTLVAIMGRCQGVKRGLGGFYSLTASNPAPRSPRPSQTSTKDINPMVEERIHRAVIDLLNRKGPSQADALRKAIGEVDDRLLDYIAGAQGNLGGIHTLAMIMGRCRGVERGPGGVYSLSGSIHASPHLQEPRTIPNHIDRAIEERIHCATVNILDREGPSQAESLRRAIGAVDNGLLDYIANKHSGSPRMLTKIMERCPGIKRGPGGVYSLSAPRQLPVAPSEPQAASKAIELAIDELTYRSTVGSLDREESFEMAPQHDATGTMGEELVERDLGVESGSVNSFSVTFEGHSTRPPPALDTAAADKPHFVDSAAEARRYVDQAAVADAVALDCEWVDDGKLALVQIHFDGSPLLVLDAHKQDVLDALAPLFAGPGPVLVFHDCREDVRVLRLALQNPALLRQPEEDGVRIFDTQVGHAMVIELEGMVSCDGEDVSQDANVRCGLNAALEYCDLPPNTLKAEVIETGSFARFAVRPLDPILLRYAAQDVAHLIRLYRAQMARLQGSLARAAFDISSWQCSGAVAAFCDNGRAPMGRWVRLVPRGASDGDVFEYVDDLNGEMADEVADRGRMPVTAARTRPDIEALESVLPDELFYQVVDFVDDESHAPAVELIVDYKQAPLVRVDAARGESMFELEWTAPIDCVDACWAHLADVKFRSDNRAGVDGTLHRISLIPSGDDRSQDGRYAAPIGLTYRFGRHVEDAAEIVSDLCIAIARYFDGGYGGGRIPSILMVGPPGVGKTTLLRDMCAVLAGRAQLSTLAVDTSGEIAGSGRARHVALGSARVMPVAQRRMQHEILLQAVGNHTPEVIVVDEITSKDEVAAVSTIAARGVAMVATCHGRTIADVLRNPGLCPLLGGVSAVTLGDAEVARQRAAGRKAKKSQLQRTGAAVFNVIVEVLDRSTIVIHADTHVAVDAMLTTGRIYIERRRRMPDGSLQARFEIIDRTPVDEDKTTALHGPAQGAFRLFPSAASLT